ncbi:MAG: prepilin-type N-terminal cleavage/methylation domain-containing protein [bacterium]
MIKQINISYGFSLVEVLIAVFILTVGLLGIAGLYINSLKRTEDAYRRTLATSQLIVLMEQQKAGDNLT